LGGGLWPGPLVKFIDYATELWHNPLQHVENLAMHCS